MRSTQQVKLGANPKLYFNSLAPVLRKSIVTVCVFVFDAPRLFNDMPTCSQCRATGAADMCSRCKAAYYCNDSCQRANWPVHRAACNAAVDFVTAMSLLVEDGSANDNAESLRLLVRAAKAGYSNAQHELGRRYRLGAGGVEANKTLQGHWLRKAAEAGHVRAQADLGALFYRMSGSPDDKDDQEAVFWFRKAAEAGSAEAQHRLGVCYFFGDGVIRDVDTALQWFRRSAEAGHVRAMTRLAEFHRETDGNNVASAFWRRMAAEAGDARSQTALGDIYAYGDGVEQDDATATVWYRRGAESGDYAACLRLGECYELGRGVERDLVQSAHWYGRAATISPNPQYAIARLTTLSWDDEARNSPAITEAKALAASFPRVCAAEGCGRPGLFACSRCRTCLYCSWACQRAHRVDHINYGVCEDNAIASASAYLSAAGVPRSSGVGGESSSPAQPASLTAGGAASSVLSDAPWSPALRCELALLTRAWALCVAD
jgi:TPR repeat protein